jgi:hypothetical protein
MPPATTHIVFSDSFAGSLSTALKELGRDETIVCLRDNLSLGPINPPDPALRLQWIRKELAPGLSDREWPSDRIARFWEAALASANRRVVWVSERAAREYAGFLEFVWRLDEADCDLVAFNEDAVTYPRLDGRMTAGRAICLGELPPSHLTATRYWDRTVKLENAACERYRANWARLREENAPLRIRDDGGLVSAPISYFDDLLIACTVEHWRKSARVIGEALCSFMDGPFFQVDDFFLAARLRALAKSDRLESRGDLLNIRFSEVRLPGSEEAPPPIV